jgi:uncharacterized membrane protein YdbT with pleckstrin-like domain
MSYIEESLGQGERLIARARFHWSYSLKAWLALILLFWCLVGIWIFFDMMVRKWTTEIAVTTHRFVKKTGPLTVRADEMAIRNIEGVKLTQGLWGQLLGYGHLRIEGTGVDAIKLPSIANPVVFRAAIETAKESGKSL